MPTARPQTDIAATSGRLQIIGPSHKTHSLNRKLSSEQSVDGRFVVAEKEGHKRDLSWKINPPRRP
jgi:hypothetical protein